MRHCGRHHEERRSEVRCNQSIPILGRHIGQCMETQYARNVAQHVEPSESVDGGLHSLGASGLGAKIGGECRAAGLHFTNALNGICKSLGLYVHGAEAHPFLCKDETSSKTDK